MPSMPSKPVTQAQAGSSPLVSKGTASRGVAPQRGLGQRGCGSAGIRAKGVALIPVLAKLCLCSFDYAAIWGYLCACVDAKEGAPTCEHASQGKRARQRGTGP